MVKISDCSCECRDKGKEKTIEERALSSINKILGTEGQAYYPDGTGAVTIPIASIDDLTNAAKVPSIEADVAQIKISITENGDEIKKIQAVDDAQAREILVIKNADDSRDGEIAELKNRTTTAEGNISDLETQTAAHGSDIAEIKNTDIQQNQKITANANAIASNAAGIKANSTDIDTLQADTTRQDQEIDALRTLTSSITKSLITDVEVTTGTMEGSFIVSVVEEDGTKRSSDSFRYGRVGTFALEQGGTAGYVRGKLTLVDGTIITSNDYQILQIIESDVYVTSITLNPDYDNGKIGGSIGYSNGNTAAINSVVVPTAPGVTSNINELLTRMSAVETTNTSQASSISSNSTRIKALEDADVSIKGRLTSVETKNASQDEDISSLKSRASKTETDIAGLSTRVGSCETKNTSQDGEISNLQARVTAIESTPGIGVFTNTKAGTILGSTAAGKVTANGDGTGSVNGWSDKADKSTVDALQARVMNCFESVDYIPTTNILTLTALDGQSNDVSLDKNWGTANAGKVLGIGNDGTAVPIDNDGSDLVIKKVDNTISNMFSLDEIKAKLGISEQGTYIINGEISFYSFNNTYSTDPTFKTILPVITLTIGSTYSKIILNTPSLVIKFNSDNTQNYYLGCGGFIQNSNGTIRYESTYGKTSAYSINSNYKEKSITIAGFIYKLNDKTS